MSSMVMGEGWGDHSTSSTIAFGLSVVLTALFIVMPCSYCCAANGIMKQDTTVLAPMMPMENMGGTVGDAKPAGDAAETI